MRHGPRVSVLQEADWLFSLPKLDRLALSSLQPQRLPPHSAKYANLAGCESPGTRYPIKLTARHRPSFPFTNRNLDTTHEASGILSGIGC